MSEEGFCEKHGPYDASLGQCPYCAQSSGLPPAPPPLDDELPTDPWGGRERSAQVAYDEEETDIGFRARVYEEEDELTEFPDRGPGSWDEDHTVVERAEKGMLGFLIVKEGMRRGAGAPHPRRHNGRSGSGQDHPPRPEGVQAACQVHHRR